MLGRNELETMLSTMARSGATMLQLVPGVPPCLRIQGRRVRAEAPAISSEGLAAVIEEILTRSQSRSLANGGEVDGFYTTPDGQRFRYSVMRDSGGVHAVFRAVPRSMPSFDQLGLPELMSSFVFFDSGLVLVTGFLGSGRTLTLSTLVDRLNQSAARHIITVEQAIEFVHEPSKSIVHQREVGRHVPSYGDGIRQALRQSADVIVIDDMEGHETLKAALDAAERGCLVLGAMPSSSVVTGLQNLVEQSPTGAREQILRRLTRVFRAMVAQTLVQRHHGQGRVPVLEILIKNEAVTRAMLSGRFSDLPEIMERSHGLGMQTVDRALRRMVASNVVTVEEALYHAHDRALVAGR